MYQEHEADQDRAPFQESVVSTIVKLKGLDVLVELSLWEGALYPPPLPVLNLA